MRMNTEPDNQLTDRLELYRLLREGLDDVAAKRTRPFDEAMGELMDKYKEK